MKKIYLVEDKENDGYYNKYESLEDAVESNEEYWEDGQVEVYVAVPELLGTYESGIKIRKVKAKTI